MARVIHAALRGLVAFAVLGAMYCPAAAADCATTEGVAAAIGEENPAVEIRILGDLMASKLRVGISTLVGQQVPLGGEYLIAHIPGAMTSYIVRFEEGCATHHGRFSHELVRAWLEGSPA